jgi:hypothetical protein
VRLLKPDWCACLLALPCAEAESQEKAPPKEEGGMSQILIGHLASYEGMGKARVQCVSGCECKESVLDGWWERHASLQVMHTVMVRPRGGGVPPRR